MDGRVTLYLLCILENVPGSLDLLVGPVAVAMTNIPAENQTTVNQLENVVTIK
jgi:hypothetical protein